MRSEVCVFFLLLLLVYVYDGKTFRGDLALEISAGVLSAKTKLSQDVTTLLSSSES